MLIQVSTNEYINYDEIVSILLLRIEDKGIYDNLPEEDVYGIELKNGRSLAVWGEQFNAIKQQIDNYNASIISKRIDWEKADE
jgi:hypothetical protein